MVIFDHAKEKKILSVVIPAYNVELYIADCLDSVIRQSILYRHWIDVIVVIDGATDNTEEIARNVARGKEDFVRIIKQENSGLSAARNTGVRLALAEYITFLDGDDIWLNDYLKVVFKILLRERYTGVIDIIEYDAREMDEFGNDLGVLKIALAASGQIAKVSGRDFHIIFRAYAWARVYRSSLIRARLYPEGRLFEDAATTPWYYWMGREIISIGKPLIGYRRRAHSIVATARQKDVHDIAMTTSEAVAMYFSTQDDYWRIIAHRSFHQGCGRITELPFRLWRTCARDSRAAVIGVNPPSGFGHWLRFNFTFLYICLLYLKRRVKTISARMNKNG